MMTGAQYLRLDQRWPNVHRLRHAVYRLKATFFLPLLLIKLPENLQSKLYLESWLLALLLQHNWESSDSVPNICCT